MLNSTIANRIIAYCAGAAWRRHTFLAFYSRYLRVSCTLPTLQYLPLAHGWSSTEDCTLKICLS